LDGNDTKPLYLSFSHGGGRHNVMLYINITECLSEMPVHYYVQRMEQKGEVRGLCPLAELRSY